MEEYAQSAERNLDEILGTMRELLPAEGLILEVASGSGQHAAHFAAHLPGITWQPSDVGPKARASLSAWAEEAAIPNLLEVVELDATWPTWPIDSADAIVNINMPHITPWETCEFLLAGAERNLRPGAPLFYYGAFFRHDHVTKPSNLEFDRVLDMPNNNYALILRQP